jgi:hypothetical protein
MAPFVEDTTPSVTGWRSGCDDAAGRLHLGWGGAGDDGDALVVTRSS